MIVTYRPEGGDVQTWEFDPARVRASAAEAIEKRAGETFEQWTAAVQLGAARARRVLLWHLLKLDHAALRFEDVPDFYAGELVVEHTSAELAELIDRVNAAGLREQQKEQAVAALNAELAAAFAREGAAGVEPGGKAPSKPAGSSTRSRSPKS